MRYKKIRILSLLILITIFISTSTNAQDLARVKRVVDGDTLFFVIILSSIGNYMGIVMLDKMGGGVVMLVPLLVVLLCLFGYNIGLLFK